MQQNITPLPWVDLYGQYIIPASHVERKIGGSTDPKADREEFASIICTIGRKSSHFTADEATANAAFIVKACNAHDVLVAALMAQESLSRIGMLNASGDEIERVTNLRRAALAAAGE